MPSDPVVTAICERDPKSAARLILELRSLVERAEPLVKWALDTPDEGKADKWLAEAESLIKDLA